MNGDQVCILRETTDLGVVGNQLSLAEIEVEAEESRFPLNKSNIL